MSQSTTKKNKRTYSTKRKKKKKKPKIFLNLIFNSLLTSDKFLTTTD